MKILVISTRLPHPQVISGHQIVHQRVKRLAARGHQIGLAVLSQPDDAEHLESIRPMVAELEIRPRPEPAWPQRAADSLASRIPARFRPYYSPELKRCIGDMVERTKYDVVLAEYGLMGQYLHHNPFLPAVRRIISVHHCHTMASQKELDLLKWSPRSITERIALRRVKRYEFQMYHSADHILVLTPEERYGVLSVSPDLRVTVIPSGVDTDFFQPPENPESELALLFMGYFDDEPNRDAVLWFCRSVWPSLKKKHPSLVFYVVGPDPSHAMLELARRDPQIIVTGWVEDIRPYLAKARVFVCPNRMGSGMRGKVLQAMASGVPVVATTVGAEGIPIQMGDNGFLADRPRIIAQYVDLLLTDPVLQSSVAKSAREMVCARFSWNRGIDELETILHQVAPGR